jgi:ABC-2 type transport system permease protein
MRARNVLHLGVKEMWSLARDPVMLLLIVFAFTVSIYSTASALPDALYKAPIAIVDEDQSALSQRIVNAFQPPLFLPPRMMSREEMDARMDAGLDTFALDIPPTSSRTCWPDARPESSSTPMRPGWDRRSTAATTSRPS